MPSTTLVPEFPKITRIKGSQSLAERYPDVASYWHPKRNGEFRPTQVGSGSRLLVWWRCPVNSEHEWQQPICYQVRKRGCSFCRGYYVTDGNSLAANYPEIAKEWHPKKNRRLWFESGGSFKIVQNMRIPPLRKSKDRNRRLNASDVAFTSKELIWWRCFALNHEWQDTVQNRVVHGRGCPECKQIARKGRALAITHPGIARLWYKSRNSLTPSDVLASLSYVAWWRCPKVADHIWDAAIYTVVRSHREKSHGCPLCSGHRVDLRNSLQVKCPEAARLWHPTKNELLPSQVTVSSGKRFFWQCTAPKAHEWDASVYNVVAVIRKGSPACPTCVRSKNRVAPDKRLSDVYPDIAKMRHPSLNGDLKPSDVGPGANKVAHWVCRKKPEHVWSVSVNSLVNLIAKRNSSNFGCPFCHGKKASSDNNLLSVYPISEKFWDQNKNAPLTPRDVTPSSGKEVWWRCPVHQDYSWQTRVSGFARVMKSDLHPCKRCR